MRADRCVGGRLDREAQAITGTVGEQAIDREHVHRDPRAGLGRKAGLKVVPVDADHERAPLAQARREGRRREARRGRPGDGLDEIGVRAIDPDTRAPVRPEDTRNPGVRRHQDGIRLAAIGAAELEPRGPGPDPAAWVDQLSHQIAPGRARIGGDGGRGDDERAVGKHRLGSFQNPAGLEQDDRFGPRHPAVGLETARHQAVAREAVGLDPADPQRRIGSQREGDLLGPEPREARHQRHAAGAPGARPVIEDQVRTRDLGHGQGDDAGGTRARRWAPRGERCRAGDRPGRVEAHATHRQGGRTRGVEMLHTRLVAVRIAGERLEPGDEETAAAVCDRSRERRHRQQGGRHDDGRGPDRPSRAIEPMDEDPAGEGRVGRALLPADEEAARSVGCSEREVGRRRQLAGGDHDVGEDRPGVGVEPPGEDACGGGAVERPLARDDDETIGREDESGERRLVAGTANEEVAARVVGDGRERRVDVHETDVVAAVGHVDRVGQRIARDHQEAAAAVGQGRDTRAAAAPARAQEGPSGGPQGENGGAGRGHTGEGGGEGHDGAARADKGGRPAGGSAGRPPRLGKAHDRGGTGRRSQGPIPEARSPEAAMPTPNASPPP
jgi:hypothetical protein